MTTDNDLAAVKLLCERWAAGVLSAPGGMSQIRVLLERIGAREIVAAHQGSSAEQLAIALMSEASKVLAQANISSRPGQLHELTQTADRLTQWAIDVRALGVRLAKAEAMLESIRFTEALDGE